MLGLELNIPAVFVDRGWVEEADSNLTHNTNKLTAFKDVEDEILKNHGDGTKEQYIHGGTHTQNQIKKWSVDLFLMNDDDEVTEEVTSVAVPDSSGVSENMTQFFWVLTVTLFCC